MRNMDDSISATQLSNSKWVWICQPQNGAFFQSPDQFKTKSAAEKAGLEWLKEVEL